MDEPVIVDMPELTLFGVSFWGNPFDIGPEWTDENAIGRLWRRFLALQAGLAPATLPAEAVSYEAHVMPGCDAERGLREVFAGRRAVPGAAYPVEFSLKRLPAALCARATFRGRDIVEGWDWLYGTWLPASGYRERNWMVEVYDGRFKGLKPGEIEGSEMDVLIPVIPK